MIASQTCGSESLVRAHEEVYKVGQGTLAGGWRFLLAADTTRKALVIRTLKQPPPLMLTAYDE